MQEGRNTRPSDQGREGVGQEWSDEATGIKRHRAGDGEQWSVVLPIDMPSLNAYMRWHFRKQKKWREQLEQYIYALGSPLAKFQKPVNVTIVRQYGYRKRAYDTDNLYAAVKPILDVLKEPRGRSRYGLGVILEDNPMYCSLMVSQEKSLDKNTRIVIRVVAK